MFYLNRVDLVGNLTRDPELRFTPTNQAVCSFALATNRRYKDQSGNWVDAPAEYTDAVVWGQLGERCNQILKKGDRVFISGRLQTRSWEAQDGTKRYKTELVAENVIGPDQINKGTGEGFSAGDAPASSSTPGAAPKKKPANAPADDEINIDDIPF